MGTRGPYLGRIESGRRKNRVFGSEKEKGAKGNGRIKSLDKEEDRRSRLTDGVRGRVWTCTARNEGKGKVVGTKNPKKRARKVAAIHYLGALKKGLLNACVHCHQNKKKKYKKENFWVEPKRPNEKRE